MISENIDPSEQYSLAVIRSALLLPEAGRMLQHVPLEFELSQHTFLSSHPRQDVETNRYTPETS